MITVRKITTYKECNKCHLAKALDDFPYERYKNKWYYRNTCKECRNEERMELYWSRREYELRRMKEYQKEHLDYFAAKGRVYRHRDKEVYNKHAREYRAKRKAAKKSNDT